jgi:uncharacterized protein YcgI (DUF1989 family)
MTEITRSSIYHVARVLNPGGFVGESVDATDQARLSCRIPPQSGIAFEVNAGETLRITDPEGGQVSDVIAFNAADTAEAISSGRTLDYNGTMRLTTGHVLYSNRGRPMFTIVEDTVGVHDFTLAPCSQVMFELLHNVTEPHPGCFENLCRAVERYEITPDAIPTAFNVFMHVEIAPEGTITVLPPTSQPGDHFDLRAEMDLLVGATACSAEQSNGGTFKPIGIEVRTR